VSKKGTFSDLVGQTLAGNQWTQLSNSFAAQMAKDIDPDSGNDFSVYVNDPVGFCRDVLGLELTPGQDHVLKAILTYERVIIKSATGVGKTFILAAAAVWLYKTRKVIEIYAAAAPPQANLRSLFWGELERVMDTNPSMFSDDKATDLQVKRAAKQWIKGVIIPSTAKESDLESQLSGKHSANLVFLFDEGDAIPDAVYKGADGCMSGGWARQVVCFNPKKKSGKIYMDISDGNAHVITMSAFDHPNVVTGEDLFPGAVTRASVVRRINEWCKPLMYDQEVDKTCFLLPDYLDFAVATNSAGAPFKPLNPGYYMVIVPEFYYKVLGEYPSAGAGRMIADQWIDDAVARWQMYVSGKPNGEWEAPEDVRPIQGQDISGGQVDAHVACLRYGPLVAPMISWRNMDNIEAAKKAALIAINHNSSIVKVDAIGVGAGAANVITSSSPQLLKKAGDDLLSEAAALEKESRGRGNSVAPEDQAKISKLRARAKYLHERGGVSASPVVSSKSSQGYHEDGRFFSVRDEMFWKMRKAFMDGNIAIPNDVRLRRSLMALEYDDGGGTIKVVAKKKLRQLLGYSPDEMDALALTYAPATTWMGPI